MVCGAGGHNHNRVRADVAISLFLVRASVRTDPVLSREGDKARAIPPLFLAVRPAGGTSGSTEIRDRSLGFEGFLDDLCSVERRLRCLEPQNCHPNTSTSTVARGLSNLYVAVVPVQIEPARVGLHIGVDLIDTQISHETLGKHEKYDS